MVELKTTSTPKPAENPFLSLCVWRLEATSSPKIFNFVTVTNIKIDRLASGYARWYRVHALATCLARLLFAYLQKEVPSRRH